MSNYSKDMKVTKPSTIVENKKIQLTEEELKKVLVPTNENSPPQLTVNRVDRMLCQRSLWQCRS